MTKAEERALEAYPDYPNMDGGYVTQRKPRKVFIQGYEQAEKDMKERFIQFVHRHYPINYIGWIKDFQKTMED